MKRANRRADRPGRGAPSGVPGRLRGSRPQRGADPQDSPLRRPRRWHRSPARGARPGPPGASAADRQREIPTIVEYSATKRPANLYPKRIVSPPHPRACCVTGMVALGKPRKETGWFYVYKRCRTCGFTVRSIVRRDPAAAKMPARASFN